jgi:hypothetical protein
MDVTTLLQVLGALGALAGAAALGSHLGQQHRPEPVRVPVPVPERKSPPRK